MSKRKTGNDHLITAAAIDRAGGRHGAEICGARRADVEGGIDGCDGRRACSGVRGAGGVCQSFVLAARSLD